MAGYFLYDFYTKVQWCKIVSYYIFPINSHHPSKFCMQFWKKHFNSKFYLGALVLAFSVALSAVMSLSKSVENQSLLEQQGLTPVLDLVTEEILKPLFIAETVSRASPLAWRMSEQVIDENKIINKLAKVSEEFDMNFFVASEKSLTQYNSDGTKLPLDVDKVEWYFRAKKVDQDIVGTLGNRENIHIYFDFKIHSESGEFLGFIGVSKKLETFITAFAEYKKEFGYDFVFVDQDDNVVLSSDPSIVADGKRIMRLQQLPWFKALSPEQQTGGSDHNYVVKVEGEDFLIAEADLTALNWKLFLVNSLQVRQSETAEIFVMQSVSILFLLLLILLFGQTVLTFALTEFASKHQLDPLTQLPNRAHLLSRFSKISKDRHSLSAIIIDIDNFKIINDTYGHAAGDKILFEIAGIFQSQIRGEDVVGRWGGEEFVILLPSTDLSTAYDIAERTRVAVSTQNFMFGGQTLNITASFGVAYKKKVLKLEDIVILADDALYKAKKEGRNTVRICESLEKTKHPALSLV